MKFLTCLYIYSSKHDHHLLLFVMFVNEMLVIPLLFTLTLWLRGFFQDEFFFLHSEKSWNKLYYYLKVLKNVSKYDTLQNNLQHKVQHYKHHTGNVYHCAVSRVCSYGYKLYTIFDPFCLRLLAELKMENDAR